MKISAALKASSNLENKMIKLFLTQGRQGQEGLDQTIKKIWLIDKKKIPKQIYALLKKWDALERHLEIDDHVYTIDHTTMSGEETWKLKRWR
jgi:hypothetical protein